MANAPPPRRSPAIRHQRSARQQRRAMTQGVNTARREVAANLDAASGLVNCSVRRPYDFLGAAPGIKGIKDNVTSGEPQ